MSDEPTRQRSSTVSEFLAAHPRMTSVLFTLLLVSTQAGQVAAGSGTYHGP